MAKEAKDRPEGVHMRGGTVPHTGRSSKNFLARIEDGLKRPSELILDAMRDETKPLADRIELAKALLPYELPRLQSIEAHVKTQVTFEDAMSELENGMIDITPQKDEDNG